MRNLKVSRCFQCPDEEWGGGRLGSKGGEDLCYCVGDRGQLFICSRDEGSLTALSLVEESRKNDVVVNDKLKDVTVMQYISQIGQLLLADKKSGTFYQSGCDMGAVNQQEFDELFRCEGGISTFAVSPDGRRLAVLAPTGVLLVLTLPDLESLVSHELQIGASAQLIDGDGDGADPLRTTSIVWRKSSQHFAVNIPTAGSGKCRREIRVYTDDGAEVSKSDFQEFEITNEILAWQPSGGLLACYGKSPHGNAVIFSELNGCKRSHLLLPFPEEVRGIQWNASSDILALRYDKSVHLWIRSNYVWMLKKILTHNREDLVRFFEWDIDNPYRVHVVYSHHYIVYDLVTKYDSGSSGGSFLTVSVNGSNVYCTPFHYNSAPPPYGFLQANLKSPVVDVLLSNVYDGFMCVTLDGRLTLLSRGDSSLDCTSTFQCPTTLVTNECSFWAWPNRAIGCCLFNGDLYVFPTSVESDKTNEVIPLVVEKLKLPDDDALIRIEVIKSDSQDTAEVLVETSRHKFIRVDLRSGYSVELFTLQRWIPLMYSVVVGSRTLFLLFDPDSRQAFLKAPDSITDPIRISTECTSVSVFDDNVLLTTVPGSLEIFDRRSIEAILEGNSVSESEMAKSKFTRKIEKGSIIVSCGVNILLEPFLILQILPRGNFETICPRPLLVSCIRTSLRDETCEMRYEKTMKALRRHRLDYKVLIDELRQIEKESPFKRSLKHSLQLMIKEVKDSHTLVLLVTDLDEDYADCIAIIKTLLKEHLAVTDVQHQRQRNIEEAYLASLAKLGMLEEALMSDLIQGEEAKDRHIVSHRVKFLSYYCDNPDLLFDTALGTYDLSLATLVADCLGKDPKETVPFLEDLNRMTVLKRKFKIDDRLKRFTKAATHLVCSEALQHDEILKYVERHCLFSDVIRFIEDYMQSKSNNMSPIVERSTEDLNLLLNECEASYGNYLEQHDKFKEAFIMFRRGNREDRAIECAIKAGEWEDALKAFFSRPSFTNNSIKADLEELCERLLASLENQKNNVGAARLCEVYLHDYARASRYWVKGRRWTRGRTLMYLCPELNEDEEIRPSLLASGLEEKEHISSLREDVDKMTKRLEAVRAEKARRAMEGGEDDFDSFSDISSVSAYSSTKSGSAATGRTYRSSKAKRKLERKLYSLKEGSRHEDLGITAHLWNVFDKIQQELKPEIGALHHALWDFKEDGLAQELGLAFDGLMSLCEKAVQDVWPNPLTEELLELKYRTPPPWLSSWDKLCLHDLSSKTSLSHR